jgi:phage terminase Nu1 subunit (DNA packaging protein)
VTEPFQVSPRELLSIIGEKEVELAVLRARLAQAQAEIEHLKQAESEKLKTKEEASQ